MDWKSLFFTADGRIGRQAFWIGWLTLLGVHMVAGWIPLIGWALGLAALFASVCLYTKRLHDMGRSGWWQLLPIVFGPVVVVSAALGVGISAIIAGATDGRADFAALASLGGLFGALALAGVVVIGFTVWVGVSQGQVGENRYGEPPADMVAV